MTKAIENELLDSFCLQSATTPIRSGLLFMITLDEADQGQLPYLFPRDSK